MRASNIGDYNRQSSSRPIRKKKPRCKRPAACWRNRQGGMEIVECVNAAFRYHKGSGQGSWRLVPKDSLEVHKRRTRTNEQQKRTPKRKGDSQQSFSYDSSSDEESRYSREEPARPAKTESKPKKKSTKRTTKKPRSESTTSSQASCCSETSISDQTMSLSNEASTTDMEE